MQFLNYGKKECKYVPWLQFIEGYILKQYTFPFFTTSLKHKNSFLKIAGCTT